MITNEIREALQKICFTLNKHDVDYMVVGGVAVGYYGYQRLSMISLQKPELKTDLDFWYNPTTENFFNLIGALKELGVNKDSLESIVFDPKKSFLKVPHKYFHTDFLCQLDGLDSYKICKKNAVQITMDGNHLHIISYKDLLKNKASINREIDRKDIEELKKRRKSP